MYASPLVQVIALRLFGAKPFVTNQLDIRNKFRWNSILKYLQNGDHFVWRPFCSGFNMLNAKVCLTTDLSHMESRRTRACEKSVWVTDDYIHIYDLIGFCNRVSCPCEPVPTPRTCSMWVSGWPQCFGMLFPISYFYDILTDMIW